MSDQDWDVVVIGAGNAAGCAALAAREHGATVAMLECAPEDEAGGNTRFTAGATCGRGRQRVASGALRPRASRRVRGAGAPGRGLPSTRGEGGHKRANTTRLLVECSLEGQGLPGSFG